MSDAINNAAFSNVSPGLLDIGSTVLGITSSAGQIGNQMAPLLLAKAPGLSEMLFSKVLLFRKLGAVSLALSAGSSAYKIFLEGNLSGGDFKRECLNLGSALMGLGGIAFSNLPIGRAIFLVSAGLEFYNAWAQVNRIQENGIDFNNGFWLAQTGTQLGLTLCLRMKPAIKMPRPNFAEMDFPQKTAHKSVQRMN